MCGTASSNSWYWFVGLAGQKKLLIPELAQEAHDDRLVDPAAKPVPPIAFDLKAVPVGLVWVWYLFKPL